MANGNQSHQILHTDDFIPPMNIRICVPLPRWECMSQDMAQIWRLSEWRPWQRPQPQLLEFVILPGTTCREGSWWRTGRLPSTQVCLQSLPTGRKQDNLLHTRLDSLRTLQNQNQTNVDQLESCKITFTSNRMWFFGSKVKNSLI